MSNATIAKLKPWDEERPAQLAAGNEQLQRYRTYFERLEERRTAQAEWLRPSGGTEKASLRGRPIALRVLD